MQRHVLVAVFLFLAGCLGDSGQDTPAPPSDESRESDPGAFDPNRETIPLEPLPNGTIPGAPVHLILDSCSRWDVYHGPLPGDVVPGEAPEGWESNDPLGGIVTIGVTGFSCGRIGIGSFERGPVEILFDYHSKGIVPNECTGSRSGAYLPILTLAVIDDAEIARFLNETYGMPARFGQIEQVAEELPAGEVRTWTWSVEAGDESTLTMVDDDADVDQARVDRYWWTRGAGMGELEMDMTAVGPDFSGRAGHGKFVEPMAMAQVADGGFAGFADWYPSVTTTNTFRLYSDHFCTPM